MVTCAAGGALIGLVTAHGLSKLGAGKHASEGGNPEVDNEHGQASALPLVLQPSLKNMAYSEVQNLLLKLKWPLKRSLP